jgi:hypothetical protein
LHSSYLARRISRNKSGSGIYKKWKMAIQTHAPTHARYKKRCRHAI